MADVRGSSGVCNDRCGCPSPCPGGLACRCASKEGNERLRAQEVLVRGALWVQSMHVQQDGSGRNRNRWQGVQVRRRVTSITSGALAGNIATVTHVAAARSNLLLLLKQAAGERAGAVAAAAMAARAPPVLPES
ncbi:hypothetical protein Dsin_026913 [Dipteronia sinensis]|uniref:Uncharacterized protein n=1 Tax=Dipteronia sinensis TaxID=43782 RepID=A0AAE0DYH3_9ROSI|nr:hypothetical protein Dsin_026913 [Dipteronia sinensis]